MKAVIVEYIDVLPKESIDKVASLLDLKSYNDFPTDKNEIIRRAKDADILAVKWIKFPREIIDKCKKLKYIVTLSSGYGFFPLKEARNRNISIINCPTHNSQAVAEHAIAIMFALSRNIVKAQNNITNGNWRKSPYSFLGVELKGKQLGLIGYGNIGLKVGRMAKGVGMKVAYVNSKSTDKEIDNLVATSDYVSICAPSTKKTFNLMNKSRLKLMKQSAFLINTARGDIVDQSALYDLLKSGKIAGAALDVFQNSPAIGIAPTSITKLARLANVVATPHIGFNTIEAGIRLGEEFVKNVQAILKGKPINVVN